MASCQFTHNGRTFKLDVTQKSQSIANNTSDVNWSCTISGSGGVYNDSGCKITVAGTVVYNSTKGWSSGAFPAKDGTESGTVTGIQHNSDGTKTIDFKLEGYSYEYTWQSRTGSLTLSTIARASTPSVKNTSGTVITQSNLGTGIRIYTNRASSSFTHKIYIKDSSTTIETLTLNSTDESNGYKAWTPAINTYAPKILGPGDSKAFTIELETFNGSTSLGTKTASITLIVPSSVVPTAAIAIAEDNSTMKTKNWGVYVQGKSQLKVTITGTGVNGSTIKSYWSKVESATNTSNSYTSAILTLSGSRNIEATVTDSRGHTSATKTLAYTVQAYSRPSISNITISRCNSSGTVTNDGTILKYSFTGAISSVKNGSTEKNSATFRIRWKLKTATSWGSNDYKNISTNFSGTFSGTITTNQAGTAVSFSASNSYDIQVQAIDAFETVSMDREIGTGFDLLNFNAGGTALAIGKMSETSDFEVNLQTRSTGVFGGSWIAMTKGASYKVASASAASSGSFAQGFLSGKTKNGAWCIGALSGQDSLYFVYGTDTNYNAGTNTTSNYYIQTNGVTNLKSNPLNYWPKGAIYISVESTSPASLFGGTWERIQDVFLLAGGSTYAPGTSAGSATHKHSTSGHTLTESEIPSHRHVATTKTTSYGSGSQSSWRCMSFEGTSADWSQTVYTGYTGGGGSHSHGDTGNASSLPPYLSVYAWKRTA